MANFIIDDLKRIMRGDNPLNKIILSTTIAFLVFNLVRYWLPVADWFALPGDGVRYLTRFWTIITYMFLHAGFLHILFNMLWLYWMGRILVEYLGSKRFVTVYFLGGIAGGLTYILVYNVLSMMGVKMMGGLLLGASAGVMAVVFAVATLLPEYVIQLFLLGPVRMKYLALGALVITSLIDFTVNMGGKLAHIGGAAMGFIFIKQLQAGKDWSSPFYAFFNSLGSMVGMGPKRKMKVVNRPPRKKPEASRPATKRSTSEQERIDAILDKISQSGYDSLTEDEKAFLFRASKKK
jgi:membrane associated rhomboid family serine protease